MSTVVRRTCTELGDGVASGAGDVGMLSGGSRSLDEFRSTPAYVLLGDPGAGKTTEFDRESATLGDTALVVSAKDFIELDFDSRVEWRDRVLFIDGLDEMRAGKGDSRVPLGEIRNRLDRLKPPGFRISCREAEWLGHSDRQSLAAVSPDSRITVLRLDELDDQQVCELLRHEHNRSDPREFMDKARQNGVGGLLVNPLTLRLLVDAVNYGGDWPDSRLKTLELACRQIATEHNQEHRVAKRLPPLATVVDAAGWLCALQLLSDIEGYVLPSGVAAPSFVSLTELGDPPAHLPREALEHTLTTKLFRTVSEGLVPLHRHVAEFLAGQHIAKLVVGGLPARRVAALMTSPSDARVVTSLRGVSAWLAAHSREARPLLIDADPVGVGLYGDIGDLSTREKQRLLKSLDEFAKEASLLGHHHRDGRSRGYRDDTAWAFGSLATADMVPALRESLNSPSVNASGDRLAALVLQVLSHADDPLSLMDLKGDLEAILWSDSRLVPIKSLALDAYMHIVPSNDDRVEVLRRLLDAVQDGSVPDPDDEVRGGLLEVLYPEAVTPSDVWRYATARRNPHLYGRFWIFWDRTLLDKSSDQFLAGLLDSLHLHAARLLPALEESGLENLPAKTLVRCLEVTGDNQESARLYGWLAAAGGLRARSSLQEKPSRRIRAWLEARPHVQKEIVLTWLRQREPDKSVRRSAYRFCEALHRSTLPRDFGLWCLDQAIEIGDTEPRVSEGLVWQAYRSLHNPSTSEGLTLEAMRDRLRGAPTLSAHLERFSERRSSSEASIEDEYRQEMKERREQWEEEQRQQTEDWANHLREHQDELLGNRFSPHDLATLANVYLGLVIGVDEHMSPRNRISHLIAGEPRLVDAVMAALRNAVLRDDLPEVDQTVAWDLESMHSWLARPVIVSLNLLDNEDPDRLDALQPAQKRKVLAIYYCLQHGANTQGWHDRWLRDDPDLVLGTLYRCAVASVRAGKEVPSGLNELNGVKGHDDQVHDVRLRLLKAFPTRSLNQQLPRLDRLLTRALDHSNHTALQALSERKQASTSMPIGQRIRWWMTGALILQGTRLRQLKADLTNSEVRIRHLATFLRSVWDRHNLRRSILADIRDPSVLRELIEILGRWCGAPRNRSGLVTLEMEMSHLIDNLIGQLGSDPGEQTYQALARLVADPELKGWHPHLERVLEEHRFIRRDASYTHPSIDQVQDTLNDGPPTNAADLAALLVDRLTDMCEHLRGGNGDFWRQFWNENPRRHLTGAKTEDSCRDALLTNLQLRLPDSVDAVREGSYAADTRSDIRAASRQFNVPIEIKKDSHPELWKAMRDQLMAKYTTDPATDGYGIYLVLWVADPNKPATRQPDGTRPLTPEELRRRLEQELSANEARKIAVIVMDVTKPPG